MVAHRIAVINVQAGLARFVFHSDARTARRVTLCRRGVRRAPAG
ncbi:hypothetical protein ACIQ6R_22045 [Streptomyces sp. NPDC096048]